jgi:hypothetical protein
MEPSGCNRWQSVANATPPKRLRQAKTVAVACDQLPEPFHGKEGVDGSSPSEGSAKAPHVGAFSFRPTCTKSNLRWLWSRLWKPGRRGGLQAPGSRASSMRLCVVSCDCQKSHALSPPARSVRPNRHAGASRSHCSFHRSRRQSSLATHSSPLFLKPSLSSCIALVCRKG